jgi:hypothetical protein
MIERLDKPGGYLGDAFLDRVKRVYRSASEGVSGLSGSIWGQINELQKPVHAALLADDNEALRSIFANPVASDLFYGVDNLACSIAEQWKSNAGAAQYAALSSRADIARLAEAHGARRVWLPTGGEHSMAEKVDPATFDFEKAFEDLESIFGWRFEFPNPFEGEYGLETSRGLVSYRAVQAIYQAQRIREELAHTDKKGVLEIGPGMGRTAYYARLAGLRDYTTADLPIGIVAQACFLGATLGPDALWMQGESAGMGGGRIRLYSGSSLASIRRTFGVVLNVDSITEMESGSALTFFRWIESHCETFLSINHEANSVLVAQMARDIFPRSYRHRNPYWMREGYVEEVFKSRPTLRAVLSRLLWVETQRN